MCPETLMKTINWEKLQHYPTDEFMQFEDKIEDSIKKEVEERLRKIEEKKLRKKKKKKRKR